MPSPINLYLENHLRYIAKIGVAKSVSITALTLSIFEVISNPKNGMANDSMMPKRIRAIFKLFILMKFYILK